MQKYKTAKGTRDSDPQKEHLKQKLLQECERIFKLYNAQRMDTPIIELYDLLLNSNSNSDTRTDTVTRDTNLQKEIFILNNKNTDGEKTALRFDLTVPFSRYVQTNRIKRMKRYQIGKVFRRDQPSANRYREFVQCDYDCLGKNNEQITDIETLTLLENILQNFKDKYNLPQYTIRINSRKLLNKIFKICEISEKDIENCCRILDKLDKITWDVARYEFFKYGISEISVNTLYRFIYEVTHENELNELSEYKNLKRVLESVANTKIDLSLARGLQYYTGIIFEVCLVNGSNGSNGSNVPSVPSVSIAGGGRYDKMMNIPCIGFSLGIDRIINYTSSEMESIKVWIVEVGTKNKQEKQENIENIEDIEKSESFTNVTNYRLQILNKLRMNNISCDTVFKKVNPTVKKSIQYANKNKIPFVIFLGESELLTQTVTIKNLNTKIQSNMTFPDLLKLLS